MPTINYLNNLYLKDVYIEINAEKIAAIKSYKIDILKDIYHIRSFCKKTPTKILTYDTLFKIKLSKIKLINKIDLNSLFDLSNFNLSIANPEYRLIFDDCNWTAMAEITSDNNLENHIMESIEIISTKKMKINNQD